MILSRRHIPSIGASALVMLGGAVVAQQALDANLNALGGRSNPVAPGLSAAPELYTVHSVTGDLVYNRANAFNDNTYAVHQRSIDRGRYFNPFKEQAPRSNSAGGVSQQYLGAPVARASNLAAPTYSPTRGSRAGSVSAANRQSLSRATYRVGPTRAR